MGRGGKRVGAGRKGNDAELSLWIGRHCIGLARAATIAAVVEQARSDADALDLEADIAESFKNLVSNPTAFWALEEHQLNLEMKAGINRDDDAPNYQFSSASDVGVLLRYAKTPPHVRDQIIEQTIHDFAPYVVLTPSRIRRCWTLANDEARREEEYNMRLAREASAQALDE